MHRPLTITGLDIGSSRVSAVIASVDADNVVTILAEASLPSKGVSRGAFTDMDAAIDTVSKVFARTRERSGIRPENIYVNISGESVLAERSKGMIPLSMRGREIAKGDIDRCIHVASTIQLPFERDVIHRIVHSFSIDDQPAIKNPLGLYASRLACEMFVITANVNHAQNIYKCVDGAGYDVRELVFTGIADSMSMLTGAEKEEGVLLLDVGSSLTESSIFTGGVLSGIDIAPIGTSDFGPALEDDKGFNDLISRIRSKLDDAARRNSRVASVVVTGGFVFADGAVERLESKLSLPAKVGIAKDIQGDMSGSDNIKLATAIGLVKYGEDKRRATLARGKNFIDQLSIKVTDLFNNYF